MKIPATTAVNPSSFTFTERAVKVPVQMTMEDVLLPGNWSGVAHKIQLDDILEVYREDRAWRLRLWVVGKGVGYIETVVLHRYVRDEASLAPKPIAVEVELPALPAGYKVNHAPKHLWRVLLEGFPDPISINHRSKADAYAAAIAHSAKANAVAA